MTFNTELWNGAAPAAPEAIEIERSLRFNSADSSNLSRTPASAGNRKTWTWAGWVKRSALGTKYFFGAIFAPSSSRYQYIGFDSSDKLVLFGGDYTTGGSTTTNVYLQTSAVYRDTSAWYHVVVAVDTTQATNTNRAKLYVNGVQVTEFSTATYPSQDTESYVNSVQPHYLGDWGGGYNLYLDGYLADVHLVDGQALDPTDFGFFDDNGIWQPKEYTGSYGTNGFHLDFSDNSTAAALGKDTSGNGNDWTVNNFVASGTSTGFKAVTYTGNGSTQTISGLGFSPDLVWIKQRNATRAHSLVDQVRGATKELFSIDTSQEITTAQALNAFTSDGFTVGSEDRVNINNGTYVAWTWDAGNSNTNITAGSLNSSLYNQGAIWSSSLTAATLKTATAGFDGVVGTGRSEGVGGLTFTPSGGITVNSLVEVYDNNNVTKSVLTINNVQQSDVQHVASGWKTVFVGSGTLNSWYTVRTDNSAWDAGFQAIRIDGKLLVDSNVSVTNVPSIASTVRANPSAGFSIVSFTGTSSSGTIGHGLGAAPGMIIVKCRSTGGTGWPVYHQSLGGVDKVMTLQSAGGVQTISNYWNSSAPSSTTFGVASGYDNNVNGADMIAYCFAPKAGISDFGSYTSTTNTSQKITVGFRPAFVLIKGNFSGSSWVMFDNSRGFSNHLLAESSNGENNPTGIGDLTVDDTGFTIPATGDNGNIRGGGTYIYAAFAEHVNPADIDSLLDSATNGDTADDTGLGGEVPGNYCTWNPLTKGTYTNGNLDSSNTTYQIGTGTIGVSSGKWYWEVAKTDSGTTHTMVGATPKAYSTAEYLGFTSGEGFGIYFYNGNLTYNGSGSGAYGAFSQGDILNVALDMDNGKVWFGKNGTWFNSGSPTAGTNALVTGLTGIHYPAVSNALSTVTCSANFGQRPFAYQAPSGFKALCTTNLPTPTIEDGSTAMDVALYTGNGSTQTISGLEFSPDLAWIKVRSTNNDHMLYDTVRGDFKKLSSNSTDAENTNTSQLSFNSDGFSLGSANKVNALNETFVAWNWDAGSSTVSNTDGSITSSVRTSASSGFSIVTWTAPTTYPYTLGHGLSAKPELIIAKRRSIVSDWYVYHSSLGATKVLFLNKTDAQLTTSAPWNDTEPTSSVFTAGLSFDNSETMIAYCFAPVEGYSAFGSYTGNGDPDGPFVYTGFRPRWILQKRTDTAGSWLLLDTARDPYNVGRNELFANLSAAEYDNTSLIDVLSNGFKIRATFANMNASNATYIYAAFAENPFSIARAR